MILSNQCSPGRKQMSKVVSGTEFSPKKNSLLATLQSRVTVAVATFTLECIVANLLYLYTVLVIDYCNSTLVHYSTGGDSHGRY